MLQNNKIIIKQNLERHKLESLEMMSAHTFSPYTYPLGSTIGGLFSFITCPDIGHTSLD